ncbi:MAG: PQQ-binding-like beta-propeller repeat protein [Planctomycetaceae bacterium]
MISLRTRCVGPFVLIASFVHAGIVHAEDVVADSAHWSRFRGPNGTGISDERGFPTTWTEEDYAWTTELPGEGHSSPVVWDQRLFVTSAADEGAVRYVLCLDPASGAIRWTRAVGMNRSHKHAKSSWASSTPATDGERVYVAFADVENHNLSAYDFDGNLVWRRNLGKFESQHGQGVSPIVYGELVIIPNDQDGPSSIVAVDRRTGRTVWSALRGGREVSYATPMILERPGKEPQLICASGVTGITSLDPLTGGKNWGTSPFPLRTVASPVAGQGVIVGSCGTGGSLGVLLRAVPIDPEGDVSDGDFVFERKRELPYVPTPVIHAGHLYLWNDNGTAACVALPGGETVWTRRVGGTFSGSPVCVDGKLYCISEQGEVAVIAASPEYELLGKSPLGVGSHSTPAIAGGRMFLRGFDRLSCLAARR